MKAVCRGGSGDQAAGSLRTSTRPRSEQDLLTFGVNAPTDARTRLVDSTSVECVFTVAPLSGERRRLSWRQHSGHVGRAHAVGSLRTSTRPRLGGQDLPSGVCFYRRVEFARRTTSVDVLVPNNPPPWRTCGGAPPPPSPPERRRAAGAPGKRVSENKHSTAFGA